MLPTIAIFVGALIIATRLPLVIWPVKMKAFYARTISVRPVISVLGLFMVGLGIFIGYASWNEQFALEFVMWIIGALTFVFGILYVIAPNLAKQIWDAVVEPRGPRTLRILAGFAVLVGLFVLILGFVWLAQERENRPYTQKPSKNRTTQQNQQPQSQQAAAGSRTTAQLSTDLSQFKQSVDQRLQNLQEQLNRNNEQIRQLTELIEKSQPPQQ